MANISGLFEIHITAVWGNDLTKLYEFAIDHKLKLVLASMRRGLHPNQYMLTKWTNKESVDKAIEKADDLASKMRSAGIEVARVKVESIASNPGVPRSQEDYNWFVNEARCEPRGIYTEFHGKVDITGKTWFGLEDVVTTMRWCGISVNLCGKEKRVLVTVRSHTDYLTGVDTKDILFERIKSAGFKFVDAVQHEFSVYDSNPQLDDGWLN